MCAAAQLEGSEGKHKFSSLLYRLVVPLSTTPVSLGANSGECPDPVTLSKPATGDKSGHGMLRPQVPTQT